MSMRLIKKLNDFYSELCVQTISKAFQSPNQIYLRRLRTARCI